MARRPRVRLKNLVRAKRTAVVQFGGRGRSIRSSKSPLGMRVVDRRDRLAACGYLCVLPLSNNRLRKCEHRTGCDERGYKYCGSVHRVGHVLAPLRGSNKTVLVRRMYVSKQLVV